MLIKIFPLIITLFVYDNPTSVIEACENLGAPNAIGCAVPNGNKCEIHVKQPQSGSYENMDMLVIGHEFWHCPFPRHHEVPMQLYKREQG